MALVIGKLVFGDDDFNFGLELCLAEAGRTGHRVNAKTVWGCDVLLASVGWSKDVQSFEIFLRRSGLKKARAEGRDKPFVLAGGIQSTLCPELLAEMADAVFVGDADDHLGAILDQIERSEDPDSPWLYRSGMDQVPAPASCPARAFAHPKNEGVDKANVVRIELARGCKYKCPFCAVSALKPYQEVDAEDAKRQVRWAVQKGYRQVSLFAPERTCHSQFRELMAWMETQPVQDNGSDVRLERIEEHPGNNVRFGMEGVSQKLRRAVGKGFSNEKIAQKLQTFAEKHGQHGVMVWMYLVSDMPGETEEDYEELRELFRLMGKQDWSRRLTLRPLLLPFSPKPLTKWADETIRPMYDYQALWEDVTEENYGYPIVTLPVRKMYQRVMDAIIHRGKARAYQVIGQLSVEYLWESPFIAGRSRAEGADEKIARQLLQAANDCGMNNEMLRVDDA